MAPIIYSYQQERTTGFINQLITRGTRRVVTKEINVSRLLERLETWGWSYFVAYDLVMSTSIQKAKEAPGTNRGIFHSFTNIFSSYYRTHRMTGSMREISADQLFFNEHDYGIHFQYDV